MQIFEGVQSEICIGLCKYLINIKSNVLFDVFTVVLRTGVVKLWWRGQPHVAGGSGER